MSYSSLAVYASLICGSSPLSANDRREVEMSSRNPNLSEGPTTWNLEEQHVLLLPVDGNGLSNCTMTRTTAEEGKGRRNREARGPDRRHYPSSSLLRFVVGPVTLNALLPITSWRSK